MSAADENHLREVAEMFGVKHPPSVDVVQQVGPKEQVERIVACMHEFGWSDVQVENGGIRYPWDPEDPKQREAIGLAMYTCHAKFPIRTELLHPSKETYRRLYDYFRDELAPCLRRRATRSPRHPVGSTGYTLFSTIRSTGIPPMRCPTMSIQRTPVRGCPWSSGSTAPRR